MLTRGKVALMVVAVVALAAVPVVLEVAAEHRRQAAFERLLASNATPDQFRAELGEPRTDVSGKLGRCASFQLGPTSLQSACWQGGRVERGPGEETPRDPMTLIRTSYRRFFHASAAD